MTLRNAPGISSSQRRFRPQLEWLEKRDCPTNNAPTMIVNMESLPNSQIRIYGQVTDENATNCMVYVFGQAYGMAQPASDGTFSVEVNPMGPGEIQAYVADEYWETSSTSSLNFQNAAPIIQDFAAEFLGGTTWKITGKVLDESPAYLTVYFGGALADAGCYSAVTQADGTFEICWNVPVENEGIASAQVCDSWGSWSALVETVVEATA